MSAGEFENYTRRVTLGGDGVYRWYYDMDMYENKSMLYTLEVVNLTTFGGVSVGGALLVGAMRGDFRDPMVRGILVIGLLLGAFMALAYWIGVTIAAHAMRGNYRIHFAMREDGIELVWSDRLKKGFALGRTAMALTGSAIGSRRVRGRWRPTLDEVSSVPFSMVFRMKRRPKWNMIDLSVPGGKFQVYVDKADFEFVENYIRERRPGRGK